MSLRRERALLQAAQKGNKRAVVKLFNMFADPIFRYIYCQLGDRQIAEELAGEVFSQFVDALVGHEVHDVSLLFWLYRRAYQVVLNYGREQAPASHGPKSGGRFSSRSEGMVISMEGYQQKKISRLVQRLSPMQQQVVLLRFIERHNLEETAKMLDRSSDSIKVIQKHALQELMTPHVEEKSSHR